MYYKVENGTLIPAPQNFTLPDGRRVFNFDLSVPLLNANGYTDQIVEGGATEAVEWYEQDGLIITRHPALVPEPSDEDEITDTEALEIITEGVKEA